MTDPRTTPVPDGLVRSGVAHHARVQNHWLGGTDNCPVDRAAGDRVTALYPRIGEVAHAGFAGFLAGLGLVEPGIVSCAQRRAEPGAARVAQFGTVAQKP
ncbi:SAM-dependent methyltransferase [Streptomyces sp. NPDC001880]